MCTTIQLHSHGNVSMPFCGKNSNVLGLDWLDQITDDNGILIPAAGVFLKLQNILFVARFFFNYCQIFSQQFELTLKHICFSRFWISISISNSKLVLEAQKIFKHAWSSYWCILGNLRKPRLRRQGERHQTKDVISRICAHFFALNVKKNWTWTSSVIEHCHCIFSLHNFANFAGKI